MDLSKHPFIDQLRFDTNGLIPAIAQDWLDGAVLMMAWMNKESLKETLRTGEAHYWSRSRNVLWHKGSTSGNTQLIKAIRYDCDSDSLLLTIQQNGNGACHTGQRSCFFQDAGHASLASENKHDPPTDICSEVFKIIEDRKINPKKDSYTNTLLKGGDNQILKKIGEESVEFVMACKDKDSNDISNEAADLIFHIQVALSSHGVNWREVLKVLGDRKTSENSR